MSGNLCGCGHNELSHYNETGECDGYSWAGKPCPCLRFVGKVSADQRKEGHES